MHVCLPLTCPQPIQQRHPALHAALMDRTGSAADEGMRELLRCLKAKAQCAFVPAAADAVRYLRRQERAAAVQPAQVEVLTRAGLREKCQRWSEEEAFARTGIFVGGNLGAPLPGAAAAVPGADAAAGTAAAAAAPGGPGIAGGDAAPAAAGALPAAPAMPPGAGAGAAAAPHTWQPSANGGSDVVRQLHRYAADVYQFQTLSACTKHKEANQSLLPGCLLGWCMECGICNCLAVMESAESPRTVFELLYCRWQRAPRVLCYDNACNAIQYCLNRECQFFQDTSPFVDSMHYRDHKRCATDFDSQRCNAINNSSLAEQKNAIVRTLEATCGYMSQLTFLRYMRHFVHRMNKHQRDVNEGKSWMARR